MSLQVLMGTACLNDLTKAITIILPMPAQYYVPGEMSFSFKSLFMFVSHKAP